jgi:hypothetical protein
MRRIVSYCIAMGALGAIMAPSAYAADNFSCRGSAARVQAPLVGTVEPTVANRPNDPCVTQSPTLLPIFVGGILQAPTVNAKTTNAANQGTAFGSVENAVVNVGAVALTADVVQANAAATCGANGQPGLSGSSQLVGLTARALGIPLNVPINAAPNTTLINLLGIKVVLNEQTTANGEITVRAIHVTAPALGIDVVVAEARADYNGNPCAPAPKPQCSDGVDNADPEDALADANDPGCHTDGNPGNPGTYNPNDNDETNKVECNDGVDNADPEDTLADTNDPGCHTDGNAGNPGTYNPYDPSESNATQCNDGVDNADPEDTLADANDPGCHTDGNPGNPGTYNPYDNDETNTPQCSDGIDNDGDGRKDFPNDPGCSGPDDNTEANTIPKTDCNDGIDNDGINGKDYPQDPGCTDAYDNSEGAHQGS